MKLRKLFFFLSMATANHIAVAQSDLRAFSTIDESSATQINFALRYADKLLRYSDSSEFQVVLGGKAVSLMTDETLFSKKIDELKAYSGRFKLNLCKQTTDRMQKHNIKLPDHDEIVDCDVHIRELQKNGWIKVIPDS